MPVPPADRPATLFLKKNGPFLLAAGLFAGAVAAFALRGMAKTGAPFNYCLDDAYIHLAIAKTLAASGTWGIRPGVFAAASSSPLWTLGLAGLFRLLGEGPFYPLIINGLCGLGLLFLAARLGRKVLSPKYLALWLASFLAATILPTIALIGMEHVAQMLVGCAFFATVVGWSDGGRRSFFIKTLLAFLLTAIRYEGLFLVGAAAAVLFFEKKDWRLPVLLLFAGALPVAAFGLFSLKNGGFFLPNPLVAKTLLGSGLGPVAALVKAVKSLYWSRPVLPMMMAVAAADLALFCAGRRTADGERAVDNGPRTARGAAILFWAIGGQLLLGREGHFYRYEAWLVALFWLNYGLAFAHFFEKNAPGWPYFRKAALLGLAAACCFPLVLRAGFSAVATAPAMRNVRENHIRMAEFLDRHRPAGEPVALNDIGAVSFFSNQPVVDLMGLASTSALRERPLDGPERMALFLKKEGAAIGILNESWFPGLLPKTWVKAGEWDIPENTTAGDERLQFFAADSAGAAVLRGQLVDFQAFKKDAVGLRLFE